MTRGKLKRDISKIIKKFHDINNDIEKIKFETESYLIPDIETSQDEINSSIEFFENVYDLID